MLKRTAYLAAARRLRHYADLIERHAGAETPRSQATLTRTIYGASIYAQHMAARHRKSL